MVNVKSYGNNPPPAQLYSSEANGLPSIPDTVPPSICEPPALQAFLSGQSASFDIDADELQVKLRAVLTENRCLREALAHSTALMLRQCAAVRDVTAAGDGALSLPLAGDVSARALLEYWHDRIGETLSRCAGETDARRQLNVLCQQMATVAKGDASEGARASGKASGEKRAPLCDVADLRTRLMASEQRLAARVADCHRLEHLVLQLRRDAGAMSILKAQVDVYQQDFNSERLERERVAVERDYLRRQLQYNIPPPAALTPTNRLSAAAPSSREASDELASRQQLSCPKCSRSFEKVEPLQEHVNRCLDEIESS